MFKLIILICCFVGLIFSDCKSSDRSRKCYKKRDVSHLLSDHSSQSSDYRDYVYDTIPMPSEVGTVGILDSPFYDCKTKSLYFVDLFKENIYRYSEESNQIYYCSIPGYVTFSFLIPVGGKTDRFVTGTGRSVYEVEWDGVSRTCTVVSNVTTADEGATSHTNGAISGSKGALFFGFFSLALCGGPAEQGLYRYSKEFGLEKLPGLYKTSNSLGFDYERKILYQLDGCTQTVRGFNLDVRTGNLTGPWIVFDNFGLPNSVASIGISVDQDGNLVIGGYRGGKLFFINPFTAQILKTVTMPTRHMTSSTYGGCDFKKFYVLTAQLDADIMTATPTNTTVDPPGGSLLVFHGMGRGQGQLKKPCIGCEHHSD